jgi:hypothetical protein
VYGKQWAHATRYRHLNCQNCGTARFQPLHELIASFPLPARYLQSLLVHKLAKCLQWGGVTDTDSVREAKRRTWMYKEHPAANSNDCSRQMFLRIQVFGYVTPCRSAAHYAAKKRCALLVSDQETLDLFSRFTNKTSELKPVKVKVKFALQQATKVQRGSRGIALLFP